MWGAAAYTAVREELPQRDESGAGALMMPASSAPVTHKAATETAASLWRV